MDNKLYFATIKSPHGNTQFCEKETRTALCDADHEHMYHSEEAENDGESEASRLDPQVQETLKEKHRQQEEYELYHDTDNPNHPDNKYGPDHMATVTNIWDARSNLGRQWPPA